VVTQVKTGTGDNASPVSGLIEDGESIVSVAGETGGGYDLMRLIVHRPAGTVRLEIMPVGAENATRRNVDVQLPANAWYLSTLTAAADFTDYGRDGEGRLKSLALILGLLVTVATIQQFFRFWQQFLVELTCARTMMDIRTHGYGHLLQLPMDFFSRQKAGETLNRFATDTQVLHLGLRSFFGKAIRETLKAFGILIVVVFVVGLKLLIIMLIAALPAIYMIRKFGRIIRRSQHRVLVAWDALLDMLQERIHGIRVVKSYTMERAEQLRFFREHRRLLKSQINVQRYAVATSPILETLAMFVVGTFVLYGGYMVFFSDDYSGNGLLWTAGCLIAMFDPIRKLTSVINRLQQADAAAGRIFEMLEEPVETSPKSQLPRHTERIEFRDVSFRYSSRPDVTVLDHVDLTVNAGETVAIVGPNGSGKTTLCNMLLRFHDPDAGQVLIDGRDVCEVSLDSLRGQIGLVTQDTIIFTDTVSANIAYGVRRIDDTQVRDVARAASADEFIQGLTSPPEVSRNGQAPGKGYDAIISSNTLSGGQKQRLAIARALLRDPTILIFDEATSQIDPESARKIHDAIGEARRNRTAFVIAHHDREILPEADRIVVMDKGKIAATGTHDELLETSALYRNIYETQFQPPET
jgi:ABC-type multidrug transport system fused ATPase/permease subunit